MPAVNSLLLTDLYQLSMLKNYFDEGMEDTAVFEFFVRKLPAGRNYLIAAGLAPLVEWLQQCALTEEELTWMAETRRWSEDFLERMAAWRFTGDVDAMPEGTPFFPDEPVVRITAPLPQAQLVESRVINILQYHILVATKAARMVNAARGGNLVDFGLRRAHSPDAGLYAARAAYLAGFSGSATVQAERLYGVPALGTMAHSCIQAHKGEREAFLSFARSHPDHTTLLIDTYDTRQGARRVLELLPQLRREGIEIGAVRIDSGDLLALSRDVRRILDEGGAEHIRVVVSGGLDEYRIRDLVAANAPIEGFGVGTALTVGDDAPYLDCAYKLQEYAGTARRKLSTNKSTWPGRKQVYRRYDRDGRYRDDLITTLDDDSAEGTPLLEPVMRGGKPVTALPSLTEIRDYRQRQIERLPERLHDLEDLTLSRHRFPNPARAGPPCGQIPDRPGNATRRVNAGP